MSRCDNQYFSSARMSAGSSNTSDRFNMREPQGNKITTTDSLYHSMISSFVFMLTSCGLRDSEGQSGLKDPVATGEKKTGSNRWEKKHRHMVG